MNRAKLQRLIEALEKILQLLHAEYKVQSEVDPFAAHLYLSRREYRVVAKYPGNHGAKLTLQQGYGRARKLGFLGTQEEWLALLNIPGAPTFPEPPQPVSKNLYGGPA